MTQPPNVLQPGESNFHAYPKPVKVKGAVGMESLGDIFARVRAGHSRVPDDAVCGVCDQLHGDHPAITEWRETHPGYRPRVCRCQYNADAEESARLRRYAQANFPSGGPRTFDSFYPRDGADDMLASGRIFRDQKGPRRMVIQGSYGSGKSHMLEAIGQAWLDRGKFVRYEGVPTLMDRLRSTYSNGSDESVDSLLHWYYGHSLILLDDLGAEKSNDGADGYVAEQITKIWDNHPWWLVISTNKTQREMAQKLGDRLASRLYSENPDLDEMMLVVNTAEDYRA